MKHHPALQRARNDTRYARAIVFPDDNGASGSDYNKTLRIGRKLSVLFMVAVDAS